MIACRNSKVHGSVSNTHCKNTSFEGRNRGATVAKCTDFGILHKKTPENNGFRVIE